MNKKLIRLTEGDLHKIVKESVNRILNEIGDTEKGQDALGQVHGRAIKRQQMLGDKGAISRKLHNTARAAMEKAHTQGKKHGFDIYDPNGSFDKGVSKGFEKAKTNESDLHKIVKETVNRILSEMDEGMSLAGTKALDKLRHLNGNVPKREKQQQMDSDFADLDDQARSIRHDQMNDRTKKYGYQIGNKYDDPSTWSSANSVRNNNIYDKGGRYAMNALSDNETRRLLGMAYRGTDDSILQNLP